MKSFILLLCFCLFFSNLSLTFDQDNEPKQGRRLDARNQFNFLSDAAATLEEKIMLTEASIQDYEGIIQLATLDQFLEIKDKLVKAENALRRLTEKASTIAIKRAALSSNSSTDLADKIKSLEASISAISQKANTNQTKLESLTTAVDSINKSSNRKYLYVIKLDFFTLLRDSRIVSLDSDLPQSIEVNRGPPIPLPVTLWLKAGDFITTNTFNYNFSPTNPQKIRYSITWLDSYNQILYKELIREPLYLQVPR